MATGGVAPSKRTDQAYYFGLMHAGVRERERERERERDHQMLWFMGFKFTLQSRPLP